MRRLVVLLAAALGLVILCVCGAAESGKVATTNLMPNADFEQGTVAPQGWSVFSLGGTGWERVGVGGSLCVSVNGLGSDVSWWGRKGLDLDPNRLYYLSYWVKRDAETGGGTPMAGLESVNRDAGAGGAWGERHFFFRTPNVTLAGELFRVGQWHVQGKVYFDDIALRPAIAVHRRWAAAELELGEGEAVLAGSYSASHRLGSEGATDFRGLDRFTCRFNTDRWVFEGPREVVYRHRLRRFELVEPEVEVSVNYHERGSVMIEASADGERWVRVGSVSEVTSAAFAVPSELTPAREVWVRLTGSDQASLQVNGYTFRARVPELANAGTAQGETTYLAMLQERPELGVEVVSLGDLRPGGAAAVELVVANKGASHSLVARAVMEQGGAAVSQAQERFSLSPRGVRRITVPYRLEGIGAYSLRIEVLEAEAGEMLWSARAEFSVPPLYDASGGLLLHDDSQLALWWCEPERKVSRERPAPGKWGTAVELSAAAGEYEAVQVVATPKAAGAWRLSASDLAATSGAVIPASEIEIRTVEYVRVENPTDELGAVGEWPDPLPPHDAPVAIEAGRNQPFWVTVHVPPGTAPGDYHGSLRVEADGAVAELPLRVHVWGFELPRETHLRSGLGLSRWQIRRYHNLETEEELRQVYELYLRSFASHRVAPYTFGRQIGVTWRKAGFGYEPELDFAGFDEDARFALEELGFNSFMLPLAGLGGGTFHARDVGKIEEAEQGTREHEASFRRYARAVESHLAARGWLDKAYVYWFDEPSENDFDFVREGMELIHRAAPRLTRLLTTQPDDRLVGAVDLWCLPTYQFQAERERARKLAGEELWWYLCTAPKAPYFTLFLDHYGTELRLWGWETWRQGLQGLLVWDTTYWSSENAYPEPALQNPWLDPMSWQSGYGLGVGARQPWGNGDGRFLYPPNRDPGNDRTKHLEGPVPSIRWELLRDGIEDYEYLWLLRAQVERLKGEGADLSVYAKAEALLQVPGDVCSSLTEFATTPEPIHLHRAKVAEAIEELVGR